MDIHILPLSGFQITKVNGSTQVNFLNSPVILALSRGLPGPNCEVQKKDLDALVKTKLQVIGEKNFDLTRFLPEEFGSSTISQLFRKRLIFPVVLTVPTDIGTFSDIKFYTVKRQPNRGVPENH